VLCREPAGDTILVLDLPVMRRDCKVALSLQPLDLCDLGGDDVDASRRQGSGTFCDRLPQVSQDIRHLARLRHRPRGCGGFVAYDGGARDMLKLVYPDLQRFLCATLSPAR